jgi:acetyl esterase/lipase
MRKFPHMMLAASIMAAAFLAWSASSATISWSDLLNRARPQATLKRAYGVAPNQYAELFLPPGKGPHRVIVLIHGGCWLAEIPGTPLMDYLAADLQKRGYAVWNIDYRRIGDAGGGYLGTFLDVAKALDTLRDIAPAYDLDIRNIVVVGHSAGSQLALWAASRPHLPRDSALYQANPLRISSVISLAGIDDLEAFRADGPDLCGGPSTIDALVGPATGSHRDVYADTSPARLLPIDVKQVIISGQLDPIVPARFGDQYTAGAKVAGDDVSAVTLPDAGHFELIDPQSNAWKSIEARIEDLEKK